MVSCCAFGNMGSRKGLDSISFQGIHRKDGANGFWPELEAIRTFKNLWRSLQQAGKESEK